jgi:hypothetical protein
MELGPGVVGQEQALHGWGTENAGTVGGCSGGRAEHPSL